MSVSCDTENSFAPATAKRDSEFQIIVNLICSKTSPLNSAYKLSIFPPGTNIGNCRLHLYSQNIQLF